MTGKNPASALVSACLQLLHLRGVTAWRNNTGPVLHTLAGGRKVLGKNPSTGAPDILGILPGGRFIGVECKYGTGHLSKEQRAFRDAIQAAGGVFLVARDVSQLDGELAEIGKVVTNG